MPKKDVHLPHVNALAERLVTDIRHRGLTVGDRYLTTAAVSRMLGVRTAVAGRAIRRLAEREILIPMQRTGTFVGPGLTLSKQSKVRNVYVLIPREDPVATHWSNRPFVTGIRREIPEVNVQFTFVPEDDPVDYVRELIDGARASGQFAGVVSVSCPPEVYRYLAELRVPAVVYGSLHSPELPIASLDVDNRESGRLLTQYLVDRGHRRIALLATGAGYPGHNSFYDGISDVLSAAGLPHNTLTLRLVRSDVEAFRAVAKELLDRPDRPTAVITRGSIQTNVVASVASDIGLVVPGDLEIVFDHEDQATPSVDAIAYPRVQPKSSFVEVAGMIGKLLKEMADGAPPRPRHVVIPVELREPERKDT